jgi:hypothetical protein
MHGGCAPQVRQAARRRLTEDAAVRMIRSLRIGDELLAIPIPDARLAAHKLPSCRRERYQAEAEAVQVRQRERDPLHRDLAEFLGRSPVRPLKRTSANCGGSITIST